MEREQRIEIAKTLCNDVINAILNRHAGDIENLRTYAVRYSDCEADRFSLQPTHSEVFYFIEDFIQIAQTLHLSLYVNIQPNADGIPAPTLNIF